jgi:hypothetical protein
MFHEVVDFETLLIREMFTGIYTIEETGRFYGESWNAMK